MERFSLMRIEQTQILTRGELARVLAYGRTQAKGSENAWRNLVIVRLACCCGLRVSEIAALRLDDVVVGVGRSHLRLRCGTKGGKSRLVPLWWDAGTLADLTAWKAERVRRRHVPATRSSAQSRLIGRVSRCSVMPFVGDSYLPAGCSGRNASES
jgi:integrase